MVKTDIRTDIEFNESNKPLLFDMRLCEVKQDHERYYINDEYYTIKCLSCHNNTLYGVMIDCNYENILHFECANCTGYYAVCFDCENPKSGKVRLARLTEHHNFYDIKHDGDDYKVVIDEMFEEESTRICYTRPTYFYDEKRFGELTGPDGGVTSTWKCNCSTRHVIDK